MWPLVGDLLPVAFGIVLSPIPIIVAVAVLFSDRPRANSVAYLIGWLVGIVSAVGVSYAIMTALEVHERRDPPQWVSVLHLVLGAVLLVSAYRIFAVTRHRLPKIVEAGGPGEAAQVLDLPKPLQRVTHYGPVKSGLLGVVMFWVNPVDVSCAIAASLDFRLSDVGTGTQWVIFVVFVAVSVSSIAVPVLMLLILGERAKEPLLQLRTFIATNTKLLNVGLVVLIGVLQVNKGIQGLFF